MATITPPTDRAAIRARVAAITRDLLRELGNGAAIEAVNGSALLEDDLGLGSIERVELLSRLDRAFGADLPEKALADARTLGDIVAAIAGLEVSGDAKAVYQVAPEPPVGAEPKTEGNNPTFGRHSSDVRTQGPAGIKIPQAQSRLVWHALEIIYGIYAAGLFFVWLVSAWLIVLLLPPGQTAASTTSAALRLYFRLIGCGIHMEGREHVGAYGACIYVSNHTSYSDVLAVMALFQTNYHFVAKSEINNMPFIGTFLRKLGHFAFERSKLRARSRQAEQMEKALLAGESLFVFAEGTFTAQPGVCPFQLGAFRAAVKTGRPIVPVAVRGARRFLRDRSFLPKPSRISVIVSPPLFPALAADGREWAEVLRLRNETRRIISNHSGEPLI
jgi:1-acyl-sn-glycerol-3-phosphate acyltransferase